MCVTFVTLKVDLVAEGWECFSNLKDQVQGSSSVQLVPLELLYECKEGASVVLG